jgi:hypothetical protein
MVWVMPAPRRDEMGRDGTKQTIGNCALISAKGWQGTMYRLGAN